MQNGDIVSGKITGIKDYGAFVQVEEYCGLIHISEFSDNFVKTICEFVSVGQEIRLRVLEVDEENKKGVVEEIFERKTELIRPPIANVDVFIVVFAAKSPAPNFPVIDKFLVNAEKHGIEPIICINKKDLVSEEEIDDIISHLPHGDMSDYVRKDRILLDYGVDFTYTLGVGAMNEDYITIEPFLIRALEIAQDKLIVLARTQVLEGSGRYEKIFKDNGSGKLNVSLKLSELKLY